MEVRKRTAVVFLVCLATGQVLANDSGSNWDLKGLRLGAGLDDLMSVAPGLKCETKAHDPGLVYCLDRKASLGGQSAFLAVKLLDGQAVYIGLENISYDQLTAAVPTLLERFGTPAFSENVAGDIHEGRRIRTVRRSRHVWRAAGDVVAMATPFDWTDEHRGTTYSSVSLMLEAKQKQWVTRYHARERATDL